MRNCIIDRCIELVPNDISTASCRWNPVVLQLENDHPDLVVEGKRHRSCDNFHHAILYLTDSALVALFELIIRRSQIQM